MGQITLAAVAGAGVVLAASGCGASSETKQANAAAFPVTVKAASGIVHIAKRPQRIVSISATATEDLFAIGAGPQVKAVDDYSTYPKNAPRTKLSGYQPNPEAIAGYRPDLVVVADDTNHVVQSLRTLDIPVLVDPPAKDLAAAYAQLEQLGKATGHANRALAVVAGMRRRIRAITERVGDGGRPLSVYHEL